MLNTPMKIEYEIERKVTPKNKSPPILLLERPVAFRKESKSALDPGKSLIKRTPLVCNKVVRIVNFVRPDKSPETMVSLDTSQILNSCVLMADDTA
jgi:hypothetical protein